MLVCDWGEKEVEGKIPIYNSVPFRYHLFSQPTTTKGVWVAKTLVGPADMQCLGEGDRDGCEVVVADQRKSSCVFGVDRNKRTSSKIANHSFYL